MVVAGIIRGLSLKLRRTRGVRKQEECNSHYQICIIIFQMFQVRAIFVHIFKHIKLFVYDTRTFI